MKNPLRKIKPAPKPKAHERRSVQGLALAGVLSALVVGVRRLASKRRSGGDAAE